MPVTISKVENVQRVFVVGDPLTTSIPCSLRPGDSIYREDGALTYRMTDSGLVQEQGSRGQALAAARGWAW